LPSVSPARSSTRTSTTRSSSRDTRICPCWCGWIPRSSCAPRR
jgi:hypothetical protein